MQKADAANTDFVYECC